MRVLREVGYWIDETVRNYNPESREENKHLLELPDPRLLREALGARPLPPQALQYLRSGRELNALLGFSYCRFQCGISDEQMGCRDLTDGVWIWPEGLVHYAEVHQVALPDEFLETMAQNSWQVPQLDDLAELCNANCDSSFWKLWYEKQSTRWLPPQRGAA
jgi:hypothetical protein